MYGLLLSISADNMVDFICVRLNECALNAARSIVDDVRCMEFCYMIKPSV